MSSPTSPKTEQIRLYKDAHPRATNAEIAGAFGVRSSYVWRALHPEQTREAERKRLAAKREWETCRRVPCPLCGSEKPARRGDICASCYQASQVAGKESRWDAIERLWAQGLTRRAIARELHTTDGAVSVHMARMRRAGRDLPYRYKAYESRVAA